jgi:hypothetical protein
MQPEYAAAFADSYWHALLFIAAAITIGAFAYGTMLFVGVQTQLKSDGTQSSPTPTSSVPASANLNMSLLESTINAFAARQGQFEALQQSQPPAITDPSQ